MSTIPRLIIADDEPEFRSMTAYVLGVQNYDFVMVDNGIAALAAAREQPPDLMLLDVNMPEMDGLEACQAVRNDPQLAEVPVVLFTGMNDREARLRGFESGADDFLGKPYDPEELRLRVRGITRLNRFRNIHEQRRRTERVISIANDGYVLVRRDGVLQQANPAAWRLLGGIPEQGGCELNFMDLVRQNYRCEPAETWGTGLWEPSEKPRLLVGNGQVVSHVRWLQLDVLDPHARDERWFRLQDVSREHALQSDLWAFHGAVSHKLRTPLNGLVGSLELLLLELEPTGDDTRELAEMARDSAGRLEESITGILSFLGAGRDRGEQSFWPVSDLRGIVEASAERGGIENLRMEIPDDVAKFTLMIKTEALSLCMDALFDNARKFHPQESPVIDVKIERKAEHLSILIQDNGIHLPQSAFVDIWEPYFQVESKRTGEAKGMGLGLAMISAIILDVGGKHSIRNRADGVGIEVELCLPVASPVEIPAPSSTSSEHCACIAEA